jgi:hypothetical protein
MMTDEKNIDIEEDACTVTCKPMGGNVRVRSGHKIKWKTRNKEFKFKLVFRIRPVDGIPTPPVPWPFGTNPPPAEGDNSTGWVTTGSFTGTIAFEEAVFEYDAYVPCASGLAVLDPMIIVGK